MDMMEMRFRMMAAMGGSAMVGQFSKYESKSITFTNAGNDTSLLSFDVSFEPKFVIFTGGSDTNGYIKQGFALFDYNSNNKNWGLVYGKYTNGNNVGTYITPTISASAPTAGNLKFLYYDGKIYVSRMSALMYWSNTDTYTFEIYG